jgi:glycosyltransferase involved in cell wall biosynthesis
LASSGGAPQKLPTLDILKASLLIRISFLLPTFNRASYIGEAIEAMRAQMGADDELLVIDDGSTDATPDIVASLKPDVRYVKQENAGKSAALNRGLSMTTGEFVMICDDDDVLRPGSVAALMNRLAETQADFVFGRYSRFRTEPYGTRVDLGTGYWPDLSCGLLVRHFLEDAFVMQNAAIVRRSAYDRVGPFDEEMLRSLDYDMFVRLALVTQPTYCDRYIFDQRKHEGMRGPAQSIHPANKSDSIWREYDRRIFLKVHDRLGLSAYAAMYSADDPSRLERAAHLQRACVNARHDLWDLAVSDLEAAADIIAGPLDWGEREICGRVLNGKHGLSGAVDGAIAASLRLLLRRSPAGRDIVRGMLDGALWRLRGGPENDSAEMRRLAGSVVGVVGLGAAIVRRKLMRRTGNPKLVENTGWRLCANDPTAAAGSVT